MKISELQATLPWGAHTYTEEFQQYGVAHRDFAHALLHVMKAAGKLAIAVDGADHVGPENAFDPQLDRFLADLVICAARMANTCPGRVIDLEAAVEKRIKQKAIAERVRQLAEGST